MKQGILLFFTLFYFTFSVEAQTNETQTEVDTTAKNLSIFPLPVVYYTPETRLAYGATCLFTFRLDKDKNTRNSQIETGIAHTQEKQWLFYVPYKLYLKQDQYYLFGELRYYIYRYKFFGVGNDVPPNYEETYNVNIPRLRINATKRIANNFYLGLRYWFDEFDIQKVKEGGLLDNKAMVGANGGTISSLGLIALRDSRDNYNYPSSGSYLEVLALPSLHAFGSDYEFSRFSIDYVKYFKLGKETILAANAYLISNIGSVPFNEMAFIGGRYKMRGYYEGRFRDRNLWMAQAEVRQHIYKRIGAVAFGGLGAVAHQLDQFQMNNTKYSGGAGLRFQIDQENKINIRLDYGIGEKGNSGLYLTFNEAF